MPVKKTEIAKDKTAKQAKDKAPKKLGLEALLEKADKKDLIQFILQATKYNAELKVKIEVFFAGNSGQDLTETYRKAVEAALKLVKVKYDFIEPAELRKGIKPLKDLLKKAKASLATNDYRDVFAISKALMENLSSKMEEHVWSDYAANDLDSFVEDAVENIKMVAAQPIAPFLRDEIFDYLVVEMQQIKYLRNGHFSEMFEICVTLADGVDKVKQTELALEKMMQIDFGDDWRASRYKKDLIELKAYFLESQNREAEHTRLLEQNLHIESFRIEMIKRQEAAGDWDAVKKLYKAALGDDPAHYDRSRFFKPYLLFLQKRGKTDRLRQLTEPFTKNKNFNAEYFTIWKSTFAADDWAKAVAPIIDEQEKQYQKMRGDRWESYFVGEITKRMIGLMVEQKMWSRLKEAMNLATTFDELILFEGSLHDHYPDACAEKYLSLIKQTLPNAAGGGGHRPIVEAMRHVWEMPQYKAQIQKMVSSFEVIYKARSSFMALLKKYTW